MRHCVGLVIATKLPHLGWAAIMQRRGVYDPEHMDWETFPGEFQVTVYGCISSQADTCFINAVGREACEELGPAVGEIVEARRDELKLISRQEDGRRLALLYGLILEDPSWLQKVRLHPASGGLYPLNAQQQPPGAIYFDGHKQAAFIALSFV